MHVDQVGVVLWRAGKVLSIYSQSVTLVAFLGYLVASVLQGGLSHPRQLHVLLPQPQSSE